MAVGLLGRSLADPVAMLQELSHHLGVGGVGFVSLRGGSGCSITEALDLTTPLGRAMAGPLASKAATKNCIHRGGRRGAKPQPK